MPTRPHVRYRALPGRGTCHRDHGTCPPDPPDLPIPDDRAVPVPDFRGTRRRGAHPGMPPDACLPRFEECANSGLPQFRTLAGAAGVKSGYLGNLCQLGPHFGYPELPGWTLFRYPNFGLAGCPPRDLRGPTFGTPISGVCPDFGYFAQF